MFRMTTHGAILYAVMLSKAKHCDSAECRTSSLVMPRRSKVEELKHLLAGNAPSTVIPREHSDRGNLLAGYALSTRVVAGRLRGDSSLMFRMTYPQLP